LTLQELPTVDLGLFLGACGLYGISTLCSQVLSAAARTLRTKYLLVLQESKACRRKVTELPSASCCVGQRWIADLCCFMQLAVSARLM
jgi:hypothetical protein